MAIIEMIDGILSGIVEQSCRGAETLHIENGQGRMHP